MALPTMKTRSYFPLGLQISARARDQFGLPQEPVPQPPASPLYPLRVLAESLRNKRPGVPVSAGQLNQLALLNEIFRFLAGRYLELRRCAIAQDRVEIAGEPVELPALPPTLDAFARLFPPAAVLEGTDPAAFLEGAGERLATAVELFVLATQTANPAAADLADLFRDDELAERIPYRQTLAEFDEKLRAVPAHGLFGRSLLELLRDPIEAAPDSLSAQLGYIQKIWAPILPAELLRQIQTSFDVLQEEQMQRGFGPGPALAPGYGAGDEPEAFSPDVDWMPNAVLIAKSVYVWLDQLSRRYGRTITRLDQIPEEELDTLARWGFTSLWLIGIWERSPASEKIKRIMGNPEAVASAYSLYDYAVSGDLGGEEALAVLEERCLARGIRLASDVVPNHTGIYSRWMREHPDWYIQLDHPPYPGYRFTGPDLSFDGAFSLRIEDGYWDHSDAAVVFQHVDHGSGRVRHIYHGNDGTHMPWNDTAQLNYLLPAVREAVIQTIIRVARRFRIIRFDAAMTLAKKHFQRLWFPRPGGGAGVPSRAEHPMSQEEFDRLLPVEFWREVVDRVAAEAPDTLLLAEAFWLMEGYFVRTLGMHRVYNSAFMNMLKTEENAKYRGVIGNILEFEPEILKRFVNFMNNPDEATAVEQFGTGDKYFGVAVLLATMPGLPMFGHGQIEGLREKYGMEYRRAYWNETEDEAFVRHHEAQVFPLLRRRHIFSGAEHFVLYDFVSGGHADENVFVYSNRSGAERALVVYHNRHAETGGWIRNARPKLVRTPGGEATHAAPTLAAALGFETGMDCYVRFRDHRDGLEYLRQGRELAEEGLYLHLGAYQYHVFLDFQEIRDEEGCWAQLHQALAGRPVPSLDRELRKIRFAPLGEALRRLLAPSLAGRNPLSKASQKRFSGGLGAFLGELARALALPGDPGELERRTLGKLEALPLLTSLKGRSRREREALAEVATALDAPQRPGHPGRLLLPYLALQRSGELTPGADPEGRAAGWMEECILEETLAALMPGPESETDALLVKVLLRHQRFFAPEARRADLRGLLEDPAVQHLLQVHWHGECRWLVKEALETLLEGLFLVAAVEAAALCAGGRRRLLTHLTETHAELERLRTTATEAGYRLERFLELAEQEERRVLSARLGERRRAGSLKILLLSSEVAPFAKTGGLADVAGSLPQALKELGHDVRVMLPFYRSVAESRPRLRRAAARVEVAMEGRRREGIVHRGALGEVPVYFLENRDFFDRPGLYASARGDHPDNAERFGFFCRAALQALPGLDFCPDVVHLNDWQTGLAPVLLETELRRDPFFATLASLLTIHNLGYHGSFPPEALRQLGIDPAVF